MSHTRAVQVHSSSGFDNIVMLMSMLRNRLSETICQNSDKERSHT